MSSQDTLITIQATLLELQGCDIARLQEQLADSQNLTTDLSHDLLEADREYHKLFCELERCNEAIAKLHRQIEQLTQNQCKCP